MKPVGNSRTSWTDQTSRHFTTLVVLLVALIVLLPAAWWKVRERYALLELDSAERLSVFRHELSSMKALCSPVETSDAFTARCHEQALFLDEFPECTGECRSLVDRYLPKPER